jgi:hypothetical protein
MMTKISFVYLLLTLAACPGVTSQGMQSARMHKRVDNAAQRDQGALMEERHLQVEESMSVSAISCMSLEADGIINYEEIGANNDVPIETPDAAQVGSTNTTKAVKTNKSKAAKKKASN